MQIYVIYKIFNSCASKIINDNVFIVGDYGYNDNL